VVNTGLSHSLTHTIARSFSCIPVVELTHGLYNSAGGVVIVGGRGKIDIDNTFEARLDLLKESALPAMRQTLFGKNPNRKFYD
jgi:vacuolar-type H+-ATPase subunit E/Vma4